MAEEYEASDYGIFTDAIGTTKKMNEELSSINDSINEVSNSLNDESVFMGPAADEAQNGFNSVKSRIETLVGNYNTIATVLDDTATNYDAGDTSSKMKVLSIDANGVMQITETAVAFSGSNNEEKLYSFLSSQGFNDAAICGILANIQHESGFDTTALGDNGTSYGICQWHNSRWDNLKSYCSENGLDPDSIEGQAQFLVYELQNSYPGVYETLQNVPNTADGAYEASYKWTVDFEVPDDRYNRGDQRGNTAKTTYWDKYGNKS